MPDRPEPYRPRPGAPLAWPDDFGTRYTIFVDTEEEFDWYAPLSRDARSVTNIAALPDAHRRFADRGAALTFMVDHPVASDAGAVATIRPLLDDGRSAVGTQLHPWVNPPFEETVTAANSYLGNLPDALARAKLAVLTDTIADAFGSRPLAFRAGRYGVGPATFAMLRQAGYALDTSMRARFEYTGDGGPDFRAVGNDAFITPEGLVELPLTTVYTGLLRGGGARLHSGLGRISHGRGVFARARLLSRVAMTPEQMPLAEALEAIQVGLEDGVRVLNFAFHSPTLVPGHTPYTRDAADLATFWRWWDAVLDLLDRRGVANASLAELLAAAGAARR